MHALLACCLIGALYIAPFYLQKHLPRSHDSAILFRCLSACTACCTTWLSLYYAVQERGGLAEGQAGAAVLELLGMRASGLLAAVALPVLLTALLFLGPLAMLGWRLWHGDGARQPRKRPMEVVRDLVVGPLTEEFAFRSCMVPVLLLQGYSPTGTTMVTPLFFGVAHLHHLHEFVVHQRYPLAQALPVVAFQFAFTTVFGWYAAFLFLRTGHLAAAVAAHALCNALGFPAFGAIASHPRAGFIAAAFCAGVALFAALLMPLTDPALYGNALGGDSSRYLALASSLLHKHA